MDIPTLKAEHHWSCPSCGADQVTHRTDAHTPFHDCRALGGLSVPFVDAATRATHQMTEREDYIGPGQIVTRHGDGRPIMNIRTIRDDGEDLTVYPSCAVIRAEAIDPNSAIAAMAVQAVGQAVIDQEA